MKKLISLVLIFGVSVNAFAASTSTCIDTDTKLMLHMNGTNGSTTFTDSSSVPKTATAQGAAALDTTNKKFGSAGGAFGANNYVTIPDSADFNFGTGNLTIDTWAKFTTITTEDGIWSISNTASGQDTNDVMTLRIDSGSSNNLQLVVRTGGAEILNLTGAHGMVTGTFYHIGVIRGWGGNANDWAITVNGTAVATTTTSITVPDYTNNFRVGMDAYSGNQFIDGYEDEFRVVKGTAVWTAGFTAPSAEYADTCTSTSAANMFQVLS
jgi:hypothetical protein